MLCLVKKSCLQKVYRVMFYVMSKIDTAFLNTQEYDESGQIMGVTHHHDSPDLLT